MKMKLENYLVFEKYFSKFSETINIYIQMMQASLPITNRIVLQILILRLILPRILVGYLRTKTFFLHFYCTYCSLDVVCLDLL